MARGQDVPSHSRVAATEWLLANGLGGSASGSTAGALVRSTQGLLVAGGRGRPTLLLLGLDERVGGEAGGFALAGVRDRPGALPPVAGRLDPWPTWRWSAGGTVIEKSLFTLSGHDAVAVLYRHVAGPAVHLRASPLCVARGPGDPPREAAQLLGHIHGIPGRVRLELTAWAPALTLWHNGTFLPARVWARGLAYPGDEAPGGREDALVPGHVEGLLAPGRAFHLVFAAEDALFKALAAEGRLGPSPPQTLAGCVAALEAGERERAIRWRRTAIGGADFTARQAAAARGGPAAERARRREPLVDPRDRVAAGLAAALRAGLARRGHRRILVATLPRGEERGAEALQALQGLISLRGFELARDVLAGWIEYLDEGLAPASFDPADARPRYDGPLPSLWLVAAAELYTRRSGDQGFLTGTLYPALDGVMQALRQGARGGVRVGADGLLAVAGMKRADQNALWYHALVAMAQLSRLASRRESGALYLAWAHEHQRRWHDAFWDEERGCLFEALAPGGPVRGLSSGQALAVSLPPALLPPERAERLVATLERELFTPWGLREAPGGDRVSTAALGPFLAAALRLGHGRPDVQARARACVEAVFGAGSAGGLVPETMRVSADGARAEPVGDPASTLAAAELLRIWVEELEHAGEPASADRTARAV